MPKPLHLPKPEGYIDPADLERLAANLPPQDSHKKLYKTPQFEAQVGMYSTATVLAIVADACAAALAEYGITDPAQPNTDLGRSVAAARDKARLDWLDAQIPGGWTWFERSQFDRMFGLLPSTPGKSVRDALDEAGALKALEQSMGADMLAALEFSKNPAEVNAAAEDFFKGNAK